ncbi:hypothetical protein AB670_00102 [Chryseobacterium sp. MOF25P]|uniref:hypothetical protein n=1 Tax=unclassified Chryseobacterium TaxID=2593645 RepID=UPI000805C48B|nr:MULTISPECIES: hypothetical protein [unclassified Chryseobacterium]OBW43572.1 hypothetical protein AB670_00102 [Chryseobacterium sp. MOF25P]OBW46654.1 hypothetical protein AB671_01149 [Chryseobacterium sp. BGARF1]
MVKDLEYYLPTMEFYISKIIIPVINDSELNDVISVIKDSRGLKSRKREEVKDFVINKFVKEKILGTPNLYCFSTDVDILEIYSAVSRISFFSYQTSLYIHSLVEELSYDIFMVKERKPYDQQSENVLTQHSIDASFKKDPRLATNKRVLKGHQINIITGQFQDNIGVKKSQQYFIADLERTLIDCTVRPFYAGGSHSVLKAFESAKGKLNTEVLFEYYSKMNFTYPYHQALGYYLEQSGYEESQFEPFLEYEQEFDFYLEYNMKKKSYDKKWRIYYPV